MEGTKNEFQNNFISHVTMA